MFLDTQKTSGKHTYFDDKHILLNDGYIVILSKWNFIRKSIIYQGSYYDDGILKVTTKQSREIQIIADGGQVGFQVEGTNLEWRVESNLTYFRIEALSGVKRAWSQPFFQQFIHNDTDHT